MSDIIDNIKLKTIINNYKKIYNFIFLYKDELINVLSDSLSINEIKNNINNDKIDKIIKKLDSMITKYETLNLILFINIYVLIKELSDILLSNISFIKNIDIFEKKYLISDSSKNNINQNKNIIIDLYFKYKSINDDILNIFIDKLFISLNIENKYLDIFEEIIIQLESNKLILNIYIKFLQFIKNLNISNEKIEIINLYNDKIKNDILINELNLQSKNKNQEYNQNSELLFHNNKIFNNNFYSIKKLHIFNNYSNFILLKKYKKLSELFKEIINISKFTNITYKDNEKICNAINLYNKINKSNLTIVLIKSNIDLINYNLTNLLDDNIIINSNDGVNNKFINKTKTIMTNDEYLDNLDNINSYINNIEYINIYHNKFLYKGEIDFDNLVKNFNSKVLLINYDNHYYNLYSNNDSNFIKIKHIYNILTNKPNYIIENYNNIINNKILENINNFNILDKYNENIQNTYNLYSNINHIELKNLIINDIKKIKLKINKENKNIIVDQILQLINDIIYKYIINKTNITLHSELLMVYLSNINSMLNKLKKELIDNYSDQLLINVDKIISDQYHNIQSIIENILDKYYTLNI